MLTSPENGIYVDRTTFGGGNMLVPIGLLSKYWADSPRGENLFSTKAESDGFLSVVTASLAAQQAQGLGPATISIVDLTGQGEESEVLIPDESTYRIYAVSVAVEIDGVNLTSQDYVGAMLDAKRVPRDGVDAFPRPAAVKLVFSKSEQGLAWVAA